MARAPRKNVKPLGGEVVAEGKDAATADLAGTSAAPAAGDEGAFAQAETAAAPSGETAAAKQPVGDSAPPPVAGTVSDQADATGSPAAPVHAGGAAGGTPAGEFRPLSPAGDNGDDAEAEETELGFELSDGAIVEVTGPRKGRRRAGRVFGREPVRIPATELSEAELDALLSDPALIVVFVEASEGE